MKRPLRRFFEFSAVGWIGVGVQLATLALLARHLDVHYLGATALAVETALLHNFVWHQRWTWGDRGLRGRSGWLRRLVRFQLTNGATSIAGNVVFMRIFVGELGLHYLAGNLASIASCAIANFLLSDRVVFNNLPGKNFRRLHERNTRFASKSADL